MSSDEVSGMHSAESCYQPDSQLLDAAIVDDWRIRLLRASCCSTHSGTKQLNGPCHRFLIW